MHRFVPQRELIAPPPRPACMYYGPWVSEMAAVAHALPRMVSLVLQSECDLLTEFPFFVGPPIGHRCVDGWVAKSRPGTPPWNRLQVYR